MSAPVSPASENDGSDTPASEPAYTAGRAGGVSSQNPVPSLAPAPAPKPGPVLWARDAALGLLIALVVVLLFVFAGSEDRGFIYVDF